MAPLGVKVKLCPEQIVPLLTDTSGLLKTVTVAMPGKIEIQPALFIPSIE